MEIKKFESLISEITKEKIQILELVKDGKWYEKEYSNKFEFIKEDTKYGIKIDGTIVFDLKLGKIESYIKTFITQYINKYLSKKKIIEGEFMIDMGKERAISQIQKNINGARLGFKTIYSTNYGIGQWVILNTTKNIEETKNEIGAFLKSKGIDFDNEYSEAMWVYRYKFSGSYIDHNLLITELSENN